MKRHSGSRRDGEQPEIPVFFVDECLGKQVPKALREAGAWVEVYKDHFAEGVDDIDWIPEVSRRNWIILSKDKNIRKRPLEKLALLSSKARAIFLTSGNMPGPLMAETFVKHLKAMERLAQRQAPPFIATITHSGVKIYLTE